MAAAANSEMGAERLVIVGRLGNEADDPGLRVILLLFRDPRSYYLARHGAVKKDDIAAHLGNSFPAEREFLDKEVYFHSLGNFFHVQPRSIK